MLSTPVSWWRTSSSFFGGPLLSLISSLLFYSLPLLAYTRSLPETTYELSNHMAQSLKLNSCLLCLSSCSWCYVQPLALELWGNVLATLDEKTTHPSPWGTIAIQNLAKMLPKTFSTNSQWSPREALFSHIIHYLQVSYPFCIVSDALGGTSIGRLANN